MGHWERISLLAAPMPLRTSRKIEDTSYSFFCSLSFSAEKKLGQGEPPTTEPVDGIKESISGIFRP
ncbi:hypothetical protein KY290_025121 [Solanum tuberosum]|uniref:Uncharacterized protein n=1 Tax=Solanum tuberosum TaxID=4113 RepID=A0ABQ7UUP3_SOLTU|nr:hypothetical protein KY289_009185 [Solanum tuberosum]KAH0715919.1 hypothetical protein KY284_008824 [Solanum tuberosum]KAH0739382.1 hypothetical protein KY290_038087 [Solanum tuberosum]KAH0754851.1 hypothetical protein KY290_025121 [Solanum tuberosum]